MRPINAKGWARIQETPVFAAAPTGSPQVFWNWARGQDATAQRVAWFLLRMADAMEKRMTSNRSTRLGPPSIRTGSPYSRKRRVP